MIKELTIENTSLTEGWCSEKLDTLCDVEYGTRVVRKRDGGTIYPVYGGGGATFFMDTFNREDCLVVARFAMSEKCTRFVNGKFFLNDSGLSVKPKDTDIVSQEFLNKYFIFLNDYIYSLARGAAQKNLNIPAFRKIEILYPESLTKQKQIVAVLDKAFEAIDTAKANAEKNLQNAKELFESYLQNVFEKKGDDWEEKQIKDLTELVTKGSSPKWQGVNYVDDGGIFFLTSKNVGEGELLLNNKKYLEEKFNEIQKTSILKKGDVLTNIVGASIGRTAIFNLDEITNINQAVCLMRCNSEKVYNYYLMYLLNSPFFKNILHDNEVDNARANLSLTFFKNLAIPLPKLSEQKEIVKNIKSFSTETKKLEVIYKQKIADLEEMKKSVLQKAFSGQLNSIS